MGDHGRDRQRRSPEVELADELIALTPAEPPAESGDPPDREPMVDDSDPQIWIDFTQEGTP